MNEKSSQQKKIQSAKENPVSKNNKGETPNYKPANPCDRADSENILGKRNLRTLALYTIPQFSRTPTTNTPTSTIFWKQREFGKNDDFCKKKRERVLFLFLYLQVLPLIEMINGVEQVFVLL